MKRDTIYGMTFLLFIIAAQAFAQHHTSNWMYKNATDTTVVPCWSDSMTRVFLPPSSMGMMMPTSMYMRIDKMPMDSLRMSHDSTFMGWYRMQAGSDSIHFDMMNNDSTYGTRNMMQFAMSMKCQFHWDSLMSDSSHRRWHLTGMKGWNGTSWVSISGAAFVGPLATFQSSFSYSAIAFIGASGVTEVAAQSAVPEEYRLMQNYPNPFNPSTNIIFALPRTMQVRLDVFNILGQNVATLANGIEPSGMHTVRFDGAGLPSGIYFYRIQAGEFTQTKRFILLK